MPGSRCPSDRVLRWFFQITYPTCPPMPEDLELTWLTHAAAFNCTVADARLAFWNMLRREWASTEKELDDE